MHNDTEHSEHTGRSHREKAQVAAWERVQIARHPDRPHTLDYLQQLCTDFVEMHGDRLFGDDAAIIGGLACFDGQTVMVMGQQKGRSTKENIQRNFGMPQPEGYRKAQRLMEHAARFGFPILTFIDTPGASPGMQSEERGIGQAIAANIMTMLQLDVPILATVIGEGGSGGALAIGVGDRVLMLENSIYSAASPESAAAILWRDASQAAAAAQTMHITAPDLMRFGVIDEIVQEPDGGAHGDPATAIEAVREAVSRHLRTIEKEYSLRTVKGRRQLLEARREKYRRIGEYDEPTAE
ncbi:MAG: acetyl-CoA carboxylase carboxyltransferase subunit alpha [Chloroflexota bacterium]|nr:acetyl-CoA carboxylase carboxyltransferase subunit alpha [Chloroflexota bacterium]